jgi:hypothetical protein
MIAEGEKDYNDSSPCSSSTPLSGVELAATFCSLSKTRPVGFMFCGACGSGSQAEGLGCSRPTPTSSRAVAEGRPGIETRAFHARLVALYGYVENVVTGVPGHSKLWSRGRSLALVPMVVRKNATCAHLRHRLEANSDEVQTTRLCR